MGGVAARAKQSRQSAGQGENARQGAGETPQFGEAQPDHRKQGRQGQHRGQDSDMDRGAADGGQQGHRLRENHETNGAAEPGGHRP